MHCATVKPYDDLQTNGKTKRSLRIKTQLIWPHLREAPTRDDPTALIATRRLLERAHVGVKRQPETVSLIIIMPSSVDPPSLRLSSSACPRLQRRSAGDDVSNWRQSFRGFARMARRAKVRLQDTQHASHSPFCVRTFPRSL